MGMKPHCGLVTVSQTLGKISKTYHWPGIHHAKVELFTCVPLGIEAWKWVNGVSLGGREELGSFGFLTGYRGSARSWSPGPERLEFPVRLHFFGLSTLLLENVPVPVPPFCSAFFRLVK